MRLSYVPGSPRAAARCSATSFPSKKEDIVSKSDKKQCAGHVQMTGALSAACFDKAYFCPLALAASGLGVFIGLSMVMSIQPIIISS